ncbi:hypothetical protein B0H17DRAFT_593669 [Mycena rosella]|uniref:DUF7029 domain-containing protein n=1 Tax=Mycena rosella TaxID=1033263 RepID=A0AAD7DIC2_MYCRO|nr:hypothetical protein B0H17DRAFT_593669 [Mycena rosella]
MRPTFEATCTYSIHPVVVLEHSSSVISTKCDYDTTTITVAFKDRSTWTMAVEDWKRHAQFLIVAFVDSCGLGRDSRERSFHVARNIRISSPKLEIIGDMEDLSLTDAIHPDCVVTIHIDSFDVQNPAAPPPSARMRRQNDGGDTTDDPSPPDNTDGRGSNDSDGIHNSSTTVQNSSTPSLLDLLKSMKLTRTTFPRIKSRTTTGFLVYLGVWPWHRPGKLILMFFLFVLLCFVENTDPLHPSN